jgi:hypothetical protein
MHSRSPGGKRMRDLAGGWGWERRTRFCHARSVRSSAPKPPRRIRLHKVMRTLAGQGISLCESRPVAFRALMAVPVEAARDSIRVEVKLVDQDGAHMIDAKGDTVYHEGFMAMVRTHYP